MIMYLELLRKPRSGTEMGRLPSNSWFLNKINQSSEDQVKGLGGFFLSSSVFRLEVEPFSGWCKEKRLASGAGQTCAQSKPHHVLLYEPQFSSL